MKAQTILEVLTGTHLVDAVTEIMSDNFEEFVITQKQCEKAMQQLQESLGESALKAEWDAIQQQFASDLFFSGILGFKANLDNFINPIARNFLDVDYNTYLRETTAHRLPAYVHAQVARDHFYSQLSPAQRELYEDVTTYVCYLETVGPKLAHYYGYMLGNELLYRIVPGYHEDTSLTFRYCMMLEDYFGKHFLPTRSCQRNGYPT